MFLIKQVKKWGCIVSVFTQLPEIDHQRVSNLVQDQQSQENEHSFLCLLIEYIINGDKCNNF